MICTRPAYAIAWLFSCTLFLVSCTHPDERSDNRRTVIDGLEREIHLNETPERLISLAPSATEIVYASGGGPFFVGVTTADDYPPPTDTITKISALPVDFEALVALDPDLVFASDQVNTGRDAETLQNLGIPTYFLSAHSVEDIYGSIERVGVLLGTEDHAQQAADSLRAEELSLRKISRQIENHPRVLFLVGDETLYAFGAESHIHHLIDLAGGESITQDIANPAPTLSEEYVIEQAPDVIIGAFGEEYQAEQLLHLHPSWDNVPAVRNDRVYSLEPDIVLRPGPRLLKGARQMGAFLHPSWY